MSEASPDFRTRPPPAALRRAGAILRPRRACGLAMVADAPPEDEPCYPLDPPLEDVRMPLMEPHVAATTYSRNVLRHRFPNAQVGDDLIMAFTEPGQREQSRLSPDVMVALTVPRRDTRARYDADRLGPPDFVLEVLSQSTWIHDLGRKLDCYQQIGVRECLLFNATGPSLRQVDKELWGFSLTPDRREPLEEVALPNGERGVRSALLGLVAYVAKRMPPLEPDEIWKLAMRWRDPATGADLPDYEQSRAGEAQARAEAQLERARADAAQRETEAAQREAQAERARAEGSQRRIAELEERLRRL